VFCSNTQQDACSSPALDLTNLLIVDSLQSSLVTEATPETEVQYYLRDFHTCQEPSIIITQTAADQSKAMVASTLAVVQQRLVP